jgi:hypothetical protein
MANPNPKTDQLALGRGKRPRLDNTTVAMRMSEQTKERLEEIAQQYDCLYAGKPWVAGLLARIGEGELIVVPAPPRASTLK